VSDKPKRETWRDWQVRDAPAARVITRAELLAELKHHKVRPAVTTTALRYWEYHGILPRPVRQKHGDVVAAVYPVWAVTIIRALRGFEAAGIALPNMRPYLRAEAARASNPPPGNRLHVVGLPPEPYVQRHYPLPADWWSRLDPDQRAMVDQAVDLLIGAILRPAVYPPPSDPYGAPQPSAVPAPPVPFVHAALHLTDRQGRETVIDLPLDDEEDVDG